MTASHPTESPPLALGNGRKGASTVVAVKQSEWLEWVETGPSPTRVGAIGLLRADPGGPDLPEPTEAAQARDGPYLRLCRSRSTKNKTAIGSRGWINAALTRRYRARRVRSRCGTLRQVGFALVACRSPNTFSFFLRFPGDATPGRVSCCSPSRVAWRARGRSPGWRLKAPDPEAPAGSRSYPTGGEPALPGSVGLRWFRSLPPEDGPSFPYGALKPVPAGAPVAPPMLPPQVQGPSPEAAQPPVARMARTLAPPAPADWTSARRDRAPPGG